MTNKFKFLVHELIHVTNTLTAPERATANYVYEYLTRKHQAYCKSVMSLDKEDLRSCSMILIPDGLSTKFSLPRSLRIYTTYTFGQCRSLLAAIEKALNFTNAQVDWFSSISLGKNELWEELNALGDDRIFNDSIMSRVDDDDKMDHIDDMDPLIQTFTASMLNALDKCFGQPINLGDINLDKVTQVLVLRSILEAYDRTIRIKIWDASWYTSMLYIPNKASVYHLIVGVLSNERLLKQLVEFHRENSIKHDTNRKLRNNGFDRLSDDDTIGAYYLLLSELSQEVANAASY